MVRRLPILLYVLAFALALVAVYVHHGEVLRSRMQGEPSASARGLYLAWTLTTAGGSALVLFGVALGIDRLHRAGGTSASEWVVVTLSLLLLWLVILDTRLYAMLGVHLHSDAVLDTLQSEDANRELRLGASTLLSILAVAGGTLAAALGLLFGCHRLAGRLAARSPAVTRWVLGGVAFLVAGAGIATAALYPDSARGSDPFLMDGMPGHALVSSQAGFDFDDLTVSYPAPSLRAELPSLERRPDVLFVVAESLRGDHFTPDLMPELTEFAKTRRCLVSSRHYAGGHTTEYGIFSLLYGLRGYHFEPFREGRVASWPLRVLEAAGYARVGASASALRSWNDSGFMADQLDTWVEFTKTRSYLDDEQVLEWFHRQWSARDPKRPLFTLLFLNATHHNYSYPPEHQRFEPVMAPDYDHFMGDQALREHRAEIYNRYRNAVGYVDAWVGRLLAPLRERIEAGEMIVVFTGDHGEEFFEHGLLGHAAYRFVNERTQVPLVFCLPDGEPHPIPLSAHVDVMPTLLDALGVRAEPELYSDGYRLTAPLPAGRIVMVAGRKFPYGSTLASLTDGRLKHRVSLCHPSTLCLFPIRTTGMDDKPTAPMGDEEALQPMLEPTYRQMRRFLDFP